MNIFIKYILTKLQQNILQNAPNCTIVHALHAWRFDPAMQIPLLF